jgi:hypothetical protein
MADDSSSKLLNESNSQLKSAPLMSASNIDINIDENGDESEDWISWICNNMVQFPLLQRGYKWLTKDNSEEMEQIGDDEDAEVQWSTSFERIHREHHRNLFLVEGAITASALAYVTYSIIKAFDFNHFANSTNAAKSFYFFHVGSVICYFLFAASVIAAGMYAMRAVTTITHLFSKNDKHTTQNGKIAGTFFVLLGELAMFGGFSVLGAYALANAIQYGNIAESVRPVITPANKHGALSTIKAISIPLLVIASILFIVLCALHLKNKNKHSHIKAPLVFLTVLALVVGVAFLPASHVVDPKVVQWSVLGGLMGVTAVCFIAQLIWTWRKSINGKSDETGQHWLERHYTPLLLLFMTIGAAISVGVVLDGRIDMSNFSMEKSVPWLIGGFACVVGAVLLRDVIGKKDHKGYKILCSSIALIFSSVALYYCSLDPTLSNDTLSRNICIFLGIATVSFIVRAYLVGKGTLQHEGALEKRESSDKRTSLSKWVLYGVGIICGIVGLGIIDVLLLIVGVIGIIILGACKIGAKLASGCAAGCDAMEHLDDEQALIH